MANISAKPLATGVTPCAHVGFRVQPRRRSARRETRKDREYCRMPDARCRHLGGRLAHHLQGSSRNMGEARTRMPCHAGVRTYVFQGNEIIAYLFFSHLCRLPTCQLPERSRLTVVITCRIPKCLRNYVVPVLRQKAVSRLLTAYVVGTAQFGLEESEGAKKLSSGTVFAGLRLREEAV